MNSGSAIIIKILLTTTTEMMWCPGFVWCRRIVAKIQTKAVDKRHWRTLHSKESCPGVEPTHPGNMTMWFKITDGRTSLPPSYHTPSWPLFLHSCLCMERTGECGDIASELQTLQCYQWEDVPLHPEKRHVITETTSHFWSRDICKRPMEVPMPA